MAHTMTLMEAPEYDPRRGVRLRKLVLLALGVMLVGAVLCWAFWDWPQEHALNHFFSLVEKGDLQGAYADWNQDPQWQQHPQRYTGYTFKDFTKDWGPKSDYGVIRSHTITLTKTVGNGVVMGVDINGGKKPLFMRVDSKHKTIGFSPVELYEGH
jgi:hypothetical protein